MKREHEKNNDMLLNDDLGGDGVSGDGTTSLSSSSKTMPFQHNYKIGDIVKLSPAYKHYADSINGPMNLFDTGYICELQSDDGCGTELNEFFEANGGARATDTMGYYGHVSIFECYVVETIFSIPLNLLIFLAHFRDNFNSKWIAYSDTSWPNDTWADLDMWCNITLVQDNIALPSLHLILILVKLVRQLILNESIEFLVEDVEAVAT